jgi:branched-subunit amino acid aminotransferase/4-amino-4-deoxychorismate lyase
MIHRHVLHNDEIRDAAEAMLTPGQLGLLAGWGIFTTIRVYDGVLFAFEKHWERMKRDAELLHVPFPVDPARFEAALFKLVEANHAQNSSMRVVVVRNQGGFWEGPGVARQFDVIALTADVNAWGRAVRLGLVPNARHAASPFAGTKILSWAYNLTWYEQARANGFDEVVLLNERGEVSECTSANIFAAFGNRVVTPPLSSGCLPGITRHTLLHEASIQKFVVEEGTLMPQDLTRADQVFITSTTRELLRVEHIEGLKIQDRSEACDTLQRAFSDYIDRYVAETRRSFAQA